MGKKSLKQSQPLDFVYLVLIVSVAWDMLLEPEYNLAHTFVAMALVTGIITLIDWLALKSRRVDAIIVGDPAVIIRNGAIDDEALRKQRLSEKELRSMLREKGVFDVVDVEIAYIEISGDLSVQKRK